MRFLQTDLNDALLDGMAGGIIREDNGEIVYATPLLEDLFGYTMKGELSLPGTAVEVLVPAASRELHRDTHRPVYKMDSRLRVMGQGKVLTGQRKDGSMFPVSVMLRGRVINGVRCVIFNVMDMTGWGGEGGSVGEP